MCERLFKLKKHALYVVDEFSGKKAPESVPAEALKLRAKVKIPPGEFYQSLIEAVKNLLDNQIDQQQFEDSLREMFTIYAYQAFTFDKLISSSVRQVGRKFAKRTKNCRNFLDFFTTAGVFHTYSRLGV